MALMDQERSAKYLKYTLMGINAEYEATVREAKETIRRAEELRDALIAGARESAQDKDGTVTDLPVPPKEGEAPPSVESTPQGDGAVANGSGSTVSKHTVLSFVDEVMADPTVDIVTQTEVRERIMASHPVSKSHLNSLRIQIVMRLNELEEAGFLELVERARAGKPNKYRKTGKRREEMGELVLKSGP